MNVGDSGLATAETCRISGADGLALTVDRYGDPAAPWVILAHGGGQTRHAWGGTAAALAARGWHALALDMRGHGDSDWSAQGDYRLAAFAADLKAMSALAPAPPVIVGASLGGMSGIVAGGEVGMPLSALVLVDVTPRMEQAGVDRIVSFMRAHMQSGFGSAQEAADAIAAYLPHRPRPRSLAGLRKNLRRRDDGRLYWHWDPVFMESSNRNMEDRDPERLYAAAANVKRPILLVRGKLSQLVSPAVAREFVERVPEARFVDVSKADHMVAGDDNDSFTAAVLSFLESLPAGAAPTA